MTAGQVVTSAAGEQIVLVEIGQKLLFENDRVKVWEVALGPGESQPWHLHHNPYLVINLEASPGRMDWLNGSPSRYVNEFVGGVIIRPTSPVHMLTNIGTTYYRNRLVELKDIGEDAVGDVVPALVPRPAPAGPAVAEGPNGERITLGDVGHLVVFENDLVRVWEIVLDPGVELAWHRHRSPHVVLPLEAGETSIDLLAGGDPTVTAEEVGEPIYREPGEVQKLTNSGTTRYRSRVIEFKYLGEN